MTPSGPWNDCRYRPADTGGHYESYFLRANHPQQARAFWIRYTIFSPKAAPEQAMAELWAIYFDGDAGRVVAVQEDVPMHRCRFAEGGFDIVIGDSELRTGRAEGTAGLRDDRIQWRLEYDGDEAPLYLLPGRLYDRGLPKAKVLTGLPNARFSGRLLVNGEPVDIDGWVGSENHNWGSRHTDQYAWGQVAGFDDAPDAFLECSTARVRLGPLHSPWFTLAVLRLDGREYAFNGIAQALRARGSYDYFRWQFETSAGDLRLSGTIDAPAAHFVGLNYRNPPGGSHTCLNSKIARCEILLQQPGQPDRRLHAAHRAAFEILTDDAIERHGIEVVNR